ncbi:MAG: OsmC family protein [Pirellulaceae bacterium]
MPASVTVTSVDGAKFTQQVEAGSHTFYGDEPGQVGGADRGPTPYEFLLAALGT